MNHSAAIAFAVVALVPIPARADNAASLSVTVPPRARELAARGLVLHAAGNYDAAVAAFTEAYALAPTPALVFDLAQAYRLGGRCEDAAVMYRRFLATAPDADARALAREQLAAMERCAAAPSVVAAASEPTAPVAPVAPAAPVGVGFVDTRHRDGSTFKKVGLGLAGAGVLGFGLATYYGARAHDAAESTSAAYQQGGTWAQLRATDAIGQRDATLGVAMAITGAVAIAAGVACYVHGRNEARAVVVVPASHGAEVHASWRF